MAAVIIIALFPVLVALADAFQHSHRKLIGSYFKSAWLGVAASFLLFDLGWCYILYLVLCWVVLFDIIYNIVRKLGILYVGKTKWNDKLLRWLCDTNQLTRTHYQHVSFIIKLFAAAAVFALFYTGKL